MVSRCNGKVERNMETTMLLRSLCFQVGGLSEQVKWG